MNTQFVLQEFPELQEIQDAELKTKTVETLALAIQEGRWTEKTVRLIPVTLNWDVECSLLEHIHAVTALCIAGYKDMAKFYQRNHQVFRYDYVVAGALVHDIGKFLEFTLQEGIMTHGKFAYMRHPFLGAEIAEKVGLPKELVYLIAMHSFEGDKSQHTAESDYVRRLDMDVFKSTVFGLRKKAK